MSRDYAVVLPIHCCFQSSSFPRKPTFSTTIINITLPPFSTHKFSFRDVGTYYPSLSHYKNPILSSIIKNKSRHTRCWWKKSVFGSKKFRSIILLNVITIIYASDIAVIKEVEAFTDPAYFSAIRFAVSSVPFLPFIFQARNDAQTRNSGLELGLWISLGYLSEALGLLTADAGRASFISLFTVLVVPLLESILGEIVPARTWFGVVMSVIGFCMLECSGSPPNMGDVFNFISAVFFGIHTLRTEHVSRKTRKEDMLPLLGYEVCVVAVVSMIWYLIGSNNSDGVHEGICWESLVAFPWIQALYTGIFSTGLCLWGEIAAMHEVSATETAVIYGMEPVWGAGIAWFILGERWGVAGWIGAALILGGSIVGQTETRGDCSKSKEAFRCRREMQMKDTLTATAPVVVSPSSSSSATTRRK